MKLIQPFEALIQNGVSLTFKFAAAGDGQIQLDILPAGKDTKTGVALPPKALFGTAAELDANLEEFVEKYANSVTRIVDVVANADQELQQAEAAAATQARKAVEDKRTKTTTKPGVGGKPSTSTPKKRDLGAGMIGEEGGSEEEHDEDQDDNQSGDQASTTLNTTGSAAPAPVEAGAPGSSATAETGQPAGALSPSLF